MERCGMSYALVDLARAMIGWVRGGLGMSVVLAEYFFSGISGSTIADVSAIGAMLTPPMLRAGYKPEHAASLVASATAMGILVPPAIFMIVLGQVTDTSVVGIFLGGFLPAAVTALCLMVVIFGQAHRLQWPKDRRATRAEFGVAVKASLVPLVVPIVIVLGFYFGVFTATEAGALVAAYAVGAALLYYRNVTLREMVALIYESALLTAAVVFLLAVASVYQFLMGMLGVPAMLGSMLEPLHGTPWLFMLAVSMIVILFGMVLEGLPAAVVLVPVVFPIAKQIGIHPIHFNIVLTAAPVSSGSARSVRVVGVLKEITKPLLCRAKARVGRRRFTLACSTSPILFNHEIALRHPQQRILSQGVSLDLGNNVRITDHKRFGASYGFRRWRLAQISWKVFFEVPQRVREVLCVEAYLRPSTVIAVRFWRIQRRAYVGGRSGSDHTDQDG
jgi:tripartite ATP-independent transporter DctM subunit